jgi:hypothetical protein
MVEENGGTILGGVSSKLNYLVVGDDAGSKLEKAKKFRQSGSLMRMIFENASTIVNPSGRGSRIRSTKRSATKN